VFQRYTELARRSIFFARYEASQFGTPEITSDELLLGILRSDKSVAAQLGIDDVESIRKEVLNLKPPRKRIATSVDLPLSEESRRVLEFAAEEADALQHRSIETWHLVLGLLRVEDSLAAQLLRKQGVEYQKYRALVSPSAQSVVTETAPLGKHADTLQFFVESTAGQLRGSQDADPGRKEALGHLIEWAMEHQQLFSRALVENRLARETHPVKQDAAMADYSEYPWTDAIDLWVSLNELIVHLLLQLPASAELSKVEEAYIEHCQEVARKLLGPAE
jgi:hypothetical protein